MRPPIEATTRHLFEVGDRLLNAADDVEAHAKALADAERLTRHCRTQLAKARRALTQDVRRHYATAEIEAAEAMCNRMANISRQTS